MGQNVEGDWYWAKNSSDEPKGPVKWEQLKELAREGELKAEMLVWKQGMDEWTTARSIDELEEVFVSPPSLPDTHRTSASSSNNSSLLSELQLITYQRAFSIHKFVSYISLVGVLFIYLYGLYKAVEFGIRDHTYEYWQYENFITFYWNYTSVCLFLLFFCLIPSVSYFVLLYLRGYYKKYYIYYIFFPCFTFYTWQVLIWLVSIYFAIKDSGYLNFFVDDYPIFYLPILIPFIVSLIPLYYEKYYR